MPHRYKIITPKRIGYRTIGSIAIDDRLNFTLHSDHIKKRYLPTDLDKAQWAANNPFARLSHRPDVLFWVLITSFILIGQMLPFGGQEKRIIFMVFLASVEVMTLYVYFAPIHYLDLFFYDGRQITIKAPLSLAEGLNPCSMTIHYFGCFYNKETGKLTVSNRYNFTVQEAEQLPQYYPLYTLQKAAWKHARNNQTPYANILTGTISFFIVSFLIYFIFPFLDGSLREPTIAEAVFYASMVLISELLRGSRYYLSLTFADGKQYIVNASPAFARHLRMRKPTLTLPV